MKKIVAWVNTYDKKQLLKLTNNIYFATSLKDFEKNLKKNIMPLFSLGLAGRTLLKSIDIIEKHPYLTFYFLDKRVHSWILQRADWRVRSSENIEVLVISHLEAVQISLYPDRVPETLQERRV